MGQLVSGPRGTHDIIPIPPGESKESFSSFAWSRLEAAIQEVSESYGYQRLTPPVFEHTELFKRGVGEATDIVEKEMYTFQDRGERFLTLRPEFTAGTVRAYLEQKLYAHAQPSKFYALGPIFRYERPQAGRYRQAHQWNVECFGSQNPGTDAELIHLGIDLARRLGVTGLVVHLNSLGDEKCRPGYREALRTYYADKLADLCADCQRRYEKNPLRLLDCKNERCQPHKAGAPRMADHLCDECRKHFDAVQRYLSALDVPYEVDPGLVRGLDYYTKTVFEVKSSALGAQDSLWGGGRYDGLVETLGGPPTPGVGFAMGMERMLMVLRALGKDAFGPPVVDIYFAPLGQAAFEALVPLLYQARREGFGADIDYMGRSLKSQMKYADKLSARYVAIVGDDELGRRVVQLRNMRTKEQQEVPFDEVLARIE